jgi:quercetin dioxygenase-like cupin family protein
MLRSASTLKAKRLSAIAPDPVYASPDVYRVMFENDSVRVLDIKLKAGEQSEMHSHPSYLVYALSSCKIKFSSMDGESGDFDIRAGETMWRDAESHSATNIGDSDCHVLNIEIKKNPAMKR